ncbi:MAG: hypothetical protein DMF60_19105 [Acidobacteria bacterium]|nr:MAG: hypothetical protein DMF60_19105 [Acidobacteriota bacterium]
MDFSETAPAGGPTLNGFSVDALKEVGRHSVYALSGAQSEITTRLLVARLDARSTSKTQSEASFKNKLELNDLSSASSCSQEYITGCKLPAQGSMQGRHLRDRTP